MHGVMSFVLLMGLGVPVVFSTPSLAGTGNDPIPAVPTTKVLAIGTADGPLTNEQKKNIMPHEVPDTVQLYLSGKIDQWYVRTDGKGVVFLLNVNSVDDAKAALEQLPLVQAKVMRFDYLALGPLSPLALLLRQHP